MQVKQIPLPSTKVNRKHKDKPLHKTTFKYESDKMEQRKKDDELQKYASKQSHKT